MLREPHSATSLEQKSFAVRAGNPSHLTFRNADEIRVGAAATLRYSKTGEIAAAGDVECPAANGYATIPNPISNAVFDAISTVLEPLTCVQIVDVDDEPV